MSLATILTVVGTISAVISIVVGLAVVYLYIAALTSGDASISAEGGT